MGLEAERRKSRRRPRKPRWHRRLWALVMAALTTGALLAGVSSVGLDAGLRISVVLVWLIVLLALWLAVFEAPERSAKDIGVALITGVVLAGAAFVLNLVLEEAFASRDRARREAETKLAINRHEQRVFRGEDLRGFDLAGMALVSSEGERFDLSFADLSDADLSKAELRRAVLRNANLSGADLREADLAQADLRGATLTNADFAGANLSGADLTGASDFSEGDDVDSFAVLSEDTRCPCVADGSCGDGDEALSRAQFSTTDNRFTCDIVDAGVRRDAHQLFLVSQEAQLGTVVGRVVATDRDADVLEYAISGDPQSEFAVDARTGVITVAAPLDIGDESMRRVELVVEVSDDVNEAEEIVVRIVIEATNDSPEPVAIYLVAHDSPVGSRIGRIEPPPGWPGERTFVIEAGDSSGLFNLDADSGLLTLGGEPQEGTRYLLNVRIGEPGLSTTLPVQVAVIGDNLPPTLLPLEPLQVTAEADSGLVIGIVEAEDPDGDDGLLFSLAAIEPAGDYFAIDPATGAVVVGEESPGVGEYVLTVGVTDSGIPARSIEGEVTVVVLDAVTRALPRRYLVEDGGTLAVDRERGVLSPEQLGAGVTARAYRQPVVGLLEPFRADGSFVYEHVTGRLELVTFGYRTIDAGGDARAEADVTIAVVVSELGGVDTGSAAGVVAAQVAVPGLVDEAHVVHALTSGNSQLFELRSGGAITTTVDGAELFAVSPWHDFEITVTDDELGDSITVPVVVPVGYVVTPGDGLTSIAAQALEATAARGLPCSLSAGEYALEVADANGVDASAALESGDALVLPDCRPGSQ